MDEKFATESKKETAKTNFSFSGLQYPFSTRQKKFNEKQNFVRLLNLYPQLQPLPPCYVAQSCMSMNHEPKKQRNQKKNQTHKQITQRT